MRGHGCDFWTPIAEGRGEREIPFELVHDERELFERPLELRVRNDQRRRKTHGGFMRLFRENAAPREAYADFFGPNMERIELDTDPQTLAAHVSDQRRRNFAQ